MQNCIYDRLRTDFSSGKRIRSSSLHAFAKMEREMERDKMKKKTPGLVRVSLHEAHEEWKRQKTNFLRISFSTRRGDDVFAQHLLEVHSRYCTDGKCSAAQAGSAGDEIETGGIRVRECGSNAPAIYHSD